MCAWLHCFKLFFANNFPFAVSVQVQEENCRVLQQPLSRVRPRKLPIRHRETWVTFRKRKTSQKGGSQAIISHGLLQAIATGKPITGSKADLLPIFSIDSLLSWLSVWSVCSYWWVKQKSSMPHRVLEGGKWYCDFCQDFSEESYYRVHDHEMLKASAWLLEIKSGFQVLIIL